MMMLAAAALGPAAASAQRTWVVDASAGSAVHDPVAQHVSAASAALGVRYEDGPMWGYGSAGLPLSGGGPAWAVAGAGGWVGRPLGGAEAGAWLGLDLFGYGAAGGEPRGGGIAARAIPGVVLSRRALRLELGAGASVVTLAEGDSAASRALAEGSARLAWSPGGGPAVALVGRYLRDGSDAFPYAGAAAELRRGNATLWAEAGSWLGSALPRPRALLAGGVELALDPRTAVTASWRQDPADPLFRNAPRRSWSLGVRRVLGGGRRAPVAAPGAVATVTGGSVTFRLPRREHPHAPALLADFTGWQPVPLAAAGEWWAVTLPVEPGAHLYLFRTAEGDAFLPPGLTRQPDGFGGFNAVLVVP